MGGLIYTRSILMIMLIAGQTLAAGFLGWKDSGCRGEATQHDQILEPLQCFTTREMMSSIQAIGLSNINNPSGSRLTLFSDLHCTVHVTTIKYSGYCINSVYGSLLFVPENDEDKQANASMILSEADQQRLAEGRQEELELDMMLQRLEKDFERDPTDPGGRMVQLEGSARD